MTAKVSPVAVAVAIVATLAIALLVGYKFLFAPQNVETDNKPVTEQQNEEFMRKMSGGRYKAPSKTK